MNDEELGAQLGRSIEGRVTHAQPRLDIDDLLTRSDALRRKERRRLLAATAVVVIVVGAVGFAVGTSVTDDGGTPTAVVVPRASSEADVYEPADLAQAGLEISAAFRAVFGQASEQVKIDSIQLGPELQPLLRRSAKIAQSFGYTEDQLARNTVTVSDPSFIDATHAIVQFSITIPDHGTTIKDRVGYAVKTGGRWQVSARTVCDIVWPGTTSPACPARPPS
jgi:hypothetical protein